MSTSPLRVAACAMLASAALWSCGTSGVTEADAPGKIEFLASSLSLGSDRSVALTVRNVGGVPVGPVTLTASPIAGPGGVTLPGASLILTRSEIPTLNPGEEGSFSANVDLGGTVLPGAYGTGVSARIQDAGDGTGPAEARITLSFDVAEFEGVTGVASVDIAPPSGDLRRGDVTQILVEVRGEDGSVMEGVPTGWKVSPPGSGFIGENGQLVAYDATNLTIVAQVGALADTLDLTVSDRIWSGTLVPVGEGIEGSRPTSDLWVHGDYAYLGTHSGGAGGNTMFVWDISNPLSPFKTDSVRIDARVVNDVKVRNDGRLAVITHEGSNDGLNGVTLLDLENPARPSVIGRFSDGLETGVHNAWIEGNYVYLVADGTGVGLRILDVSDPERPVQVASFIGSPTTFLHDVYVRDGLAFLSHWNAGLIVLDVGNGMAGGSPTNPVEVSRVRTTGGQTHNAWYWPETGYVFVGEEDFASPGRMHVVDFRDPLNPHEIATFAVADDPPHNFWLDEDQGVLYLAWYGQGIHALDVNGELLGDLDRQGRAVASVRHRGPTGCAAGGTCTWAPQLHRGLLFVTDISKGLTVLDPTL